MSDRFMAINLRQITTGQAGNGATKATKASDTVTVKDNSVATKTVKQQDSLQLSDKSQLVKSLLSDISNRPVVDESRVQQLRQSIASGDFSVSADKIASKLLILDNGLRKLS